MNVEVEMNVEFDVEVVEGVEFENKDFVLVM